MRSLQSSLHIQRLFPITIALSYVTLTNVISLYTSHPRLRKDMDLCLYTGLFQAKTILSNVVLAYARIQVKFLLELILSFRLLE